MEKTYTTIKEFFNELNKINTKNINKEKNSLILYADSINSPIGTIISISNDNFLFSLNFLDRVASKKEIEKLQDKFNATIIPGITVISKQIKIELELYFDKKLTDFKTPIFYLGSNFQKSVWDELRRIKFGKTSSYKKIANNISNPKAVRAVGNTNGANNLVIIIPCHRVIQSNGQLGGYSSGIERKKWLLNHEKNIKENQYG